jgi:hypothetical protein
MSKAESARSHVGSKTRDVLADTTIPATLRTSKMRVPDFFIIGHEKCGTTALYRMLKSHPQIYMPDIKEPRFFMRDPDSRVPRRAGGRLPHTLEEYLSLFAGANPEQRVGEASPQYIRSPAAAQRIADVQPDARIIAILREPTSFLHSFHLHCVRGNIETQRDLRKAMALEGQRRQGRRIPRGCQAPDRLLYSDHVRYVEQLRHYQTVFSREQILVILYDDLRRDNDATARRVLRFLEVDDTAPIEVLNTTGRRVQAVRFARLHNMTLALKGARLRPAAAGPVSRTVSSLIPKQLEPIWRRVVYATPRPLDEVFMLELRRRFKPEVVALSDYLGRDLVTQWGYDSIS